MGRFASMGGQGLYCMGGMAKKSDHYVESIDILRSVTVGGQSAYTMIGDLNTHLTGVFVASVV
jgi:hypothetical protein